MTTQKIHFTKEKETLLLTLYPKAVQSQWTQPILPDPWAEEAIRHIDYDFGKFDRGVTGRLSARIGCVSIASRAATFDRLTTRYLADHPDAAVLHLGCGMDTRVFRIDPPSSVQWFDVDYPDVIDLRRQLYPERPNYRLIGSPLEDLHWLDEIPGDRPVLMVAEGSLPYLTETQVKALLNAVTGRFPGGQVVFDTMPSWFVRSRANSNLGGTGAAFRWGLDDPQDIKRLEPKLELIEQIPTSQRFGFSRFDLVSRAMLRALEVLPAWRGWQQILAYRF